jgi:hypothetical protein
VRFRSKSCLFFDPDGQNQQRGLVVAIDAAKVPAGECGVENQVGRVGVISLHPKQINYLLTTRFEPLGVVDVTKSKLGKARFHN